MSARDQNRCFGRFDQTGFVGKPHFTDGHCFIFQFDNSTGEYSAPV